MSRFLKSREWCPIHKSLFCTPCHKPKKQRKDLPKFPPKFRPNVERIEDPHSPKGYREICSDQELRRRKKQKIAEQHGKCAQCGRKFGSWQDAELAYLWPELHHVENSKMGGGFRDDSYDNLEADCHSCHEKITGLPQWGKVSA